MIEEPCKFHDGNAENRKIGENRIVFSSTKRKAHLCCKMNRLFGRGKPKEPPPNLTDAISNVSISKSNWMSSSLDVDVIFCTPSLAC